MQLIAILIILIAICSYDEVHAEKSISVHLMNYGDSADVDIWEGLILYQTDLSDQTELSAKYGVDSVTSVSFNTISESTGNPEAQVRHSGSLSLNHFYTRNISGATSLQVSSKEDYFSYTAGQSMTFPIIDHLTTLSFAGFYTKNVNSPNIPTTNSVLLPPPNRSLDSDQLTAIMSIERLLSLKSKLKILAEMYRQSGYLSTGYQRVPITTGTTSGMALESVPDSRTGMSVAAVYSRWLFNNSAMHIRGRYSQDSYNVTAMSADVTFLKYLTDLLIGEFRYRYYRQTSASFYGDIFDVLPSEYFTNHQALSEFFSNMIGLGLTYEIEKWGSVKLWGDVYGADTGFNYLTISLGYEQKF